VRTGAKPRTSKLDPYKHYLRSRLEKFDLPTTVLLREIRGKGYAGAVTILKEFIGPIKNSETEPGRQAQVDWGECGRILVQGVRCKLYVFVFLADQPGAVGDQLGPNLLASHKWLRDRRGFGTVTTLKRAAWASGIIWQELHRATRTTRVSTD
jgi:transposase